MPVFVDDIATIGSLEQVQRDIRNCARMEVEKKLKSGLRRTNYMIVKSREKEKVISEKVKSGVIKKVER